MTFTSDAKAAFNSRQPTVEPPARGEGAARKFSRAIGNRDVTFVEYDTAGRAVVAVDDARFVIQRVRDITPDAWTVRAELIRDCVNNHRTLVAVTHQGMIDAGVETTRRDRDDYFLAEVGRALVETPKCPQCQAVYP